jgi:hypothetical protein
VFSCRMWRVCCLHKWLCGTGAACILCGDIHSAAVCWRGMELCVLMFCIVIICGVVYRILTIKVYFVHLFILLLCQKKYGIFKAVYVSAILGYLCYLIVF